MPDNGHVDSLALIDSARVALEQARTLADIGAVMEIAERARRYASAAKLGQEAVNHAARLRVDAERKAGEVLLETPKHPAGRPSVNRSNDVTDLPPKLSELGINKQQSSAWQAMARMPDMAYRRHIEEKVKADKPITTEAIVKEARKIAQTQGDAMLEQLPDPGDAHRRAKIKRAYSSAVLQVMQGFMTIDAAVTVEVLDRDERREFQRFADSLRARLDVWESALQQGLHVVGG
jgi:hypothetical protein